MPSLELRLFGSPDLLRDGQPVHFDTRKALALLAYLALTAQAHSRDSLAVLFWPEFDQTHARATLRRTLSSLSAAVGPHHLAVDRQTIGIHPTAALVCDVARFTAAIARVRGHAHSPALSCPDCTRWLQEATQLYRGDFMAGFSLRDSLEFDDWQLTQTEHLRREHSFALDRLTALLITGGEMTDALPYARRWLNLDPLHEPVHARLMQLYAWTGQQSTALRQYQDCVHILDRELGVPPLQETTALYEAIRDHHLPPPPVSPSPPPPVSPSPPPPVSPSHPLVGRETEIAALSQAYAAPSTRLIAIIGEAGIGKTRLAEEFLTAARAQDGVVLTAACYEGETALAYGPILAALRSGLAQPGASSRLSALPPRILADCARLLPELSTLTPDLNPAPPIDASAAQLRLFEAVLELVQTLLTGPRPGILFLDDAQWADDATLDLLAFVIRRLQTRPSANAPRALVAWRSEDIGPEHRLSRLLGEARRGGAAASVELSRLSLTAVWELVQNAWGTKADPRLGERLLAESEGLPFVLVEYLNLLHPDSDLLTADWPLPANVQSLLHAHLARISETAWQTLTTAAVIGRKFDFESVRAASGRSEDETIAALEELAVKGLATELRPDAPDLSPTFDFRHEKLRTLVYEETGLARRRLLHHRVAEHLAKGAHDPRKSGPLAGQIARHYLLSGEMEAAAAFFHLAGEHARSVYAHTEALAHFRAALAAGHPQPGLLHEAIGDLLTLAGDYQTALRAYETAATYGDPLALARLEHKLGAVYHRQGDWHLAESHFQAALMALGEGEPTVLHAHIYADWSLTAYRLNQSGGRAQELAGRALSLAEETGDRRALAQAHNLLGILAKNSGQMEAAAIHLEQSLALARELADPGAQAAALNNLALLHAATGDLPQALDLTAQALELCTASGDRHRQAALLNHMADLLHAAGRGDEAMARLKQAVVIFAEIGVTTGEPQPEIWKLVEW